MPARPLYDADPPDPAFPGAPVELAIACDSHGSAGETVTTKADGVDHCWSKAFLPLSWGVDMG
ncbi:hypothetical protein [Nonomuraea sediminis]|uniref:hypothetical protein n=1 Tax=Nonomuraea sediminis TaxID=2835864 RepID=UPI001BDBCF0F|nr:hypothetical protein [Nonomuraea sediminis]